MRDRTRLAVSVLVVQMGSSTPMTCVGADVANRAACRSKARHRFAASPSTALDASRSSRTSRVERCIAQQPLKGLLRQLLRSGGAANCSPGTRPGQYASSASRPVSSCLVPGLGERDRRKAAETHLAPTLCWRHAKNPTTCSGRRDLQGKSVDATHAPTSWLDQPPNFAAPTIPWLCEAFRALQRRLSTHQYDPDCAGFTWTLVDDVSAILPMKKAPFGAWFRGGLGGAGGIRTLDAGFAHILP